MTTTNLTEPTQDAATIKAARRVLIADYCALVLQTQEKNLISQSMQITALGKIAQRASAIVRDLAEQRVEALEKSYQLRQDIEGFKAKLN